MPTFDLGLLIPLLAAHFVTDFVLQSDRQVANKGRPGVFLLHILITGVCAYLLIGDFQEWRIPLLLAASHGLIDLLKLRLVSSGSLKEPTAFAADQLAHLLVMLSLSAIDWNRVGLLEPWWQDRNPASYLTALLYLAGLIATTQGAGLYIAKLLPALLDTDTGKLSSETGFARAGRYIGYLERLLLFIFVMADQLPAVGFLIAAKSIFRFQKAQEERKQTEYVLLGTLLSFTAGIALSFATRALLP